MKQYQLIILFLVVNFSALGLGNLLQGEGPSGNWYQTLQIAPWTPPGWVFGAAWTTIMLCFSFFMASLTKYERSDKLILLFSTQFFLNIIWNAVFFKHHMIGLALILLIALTLLIAYFLFAYTARLRLNALLVVPYVMWLCIACSLNAYVWLNN